MWQIHQIPGQIFWFTEIRFLWLTAYCQEVIWEKKLWLNYSSNNNTFAKGNYCSFRLIPNVLWKCDQFDIEKKNYSGLIHAIKVRRSVSFHYTIPHPSFLPLSPVSPILTQIKKICIMKEYQMYYIKDEGISFSPKMIERGKLTEVWAKNN